MTTESAWFAARPSGTEDVYKIYAESFQGAEHLARVQAEAKDVVSRGPRRMSEAADEPGPRGRLLLVTAARAQARAALALALAARLGHAVVVDGAALERPSRVGAARAVDRATDRRSSCGCGCCAGRRPSPWRRPTSSRASTRSSPRTRSATGSRTSSTSSSPSRCTSSSSRDERRPGDAALGAVGRGHGRRRTHVAEDVVARLDEAVVVTPTPDLTHEHPATSIRTQHRRRPRLERRTAWPCFEHGVVVRRGRS